MNPACFSIQPACQRNTRFNWWAVLLAIIAGLLPGCKMGPDYQRPKTVSPPTWRGPHDPVESLANAEWYAFYSDPVLTNLISIAITKNKDIRIAAARVEQALSGYRSQRSSLFPSVDGSAGWTRARSGMTGTTGNQFDAFALLSYEVDIWGRIRRLTEAAKASYLQSEEVRKTVYLSLIAQVASTYFNLRALDQQLDIAQRTYMSRTNSLELTRIKYDDGNGIVSELDVRQAETQVFSAQAAMAQLERSIAVTENTLNYLLGLNPGPVPRGGKLEEQPQPIEIPAGLPSDLLLRRPDVLAAEQQLIAANANIGAARAAYFPVISLSGALGLQSPELSDLFDIGTSKAWRFAPQVVGPIFNAGKTRAGVQLAEAIRAEALSTYEQAIQNAFREVEDGLISVAKLRQQIVAEQATVKAERRRLEISKDRYENGVSSFLDVLDAERSLFNAELTLVQSQSSLLSAYAALYKALGGGWIPNTEDPVSNAH